jgi:integrase
MADPHPHANPELPMPDALDSALALSSSRPQDDLALVELVEHANNYAAAARSESTRRAYRSDWGAFERWCQPHGLAPLPALPETVALYLVHLADRGRKVATIGRALAALSQAHRFAGLPSPRGTARVGETMRGIRRRLGVAPEGKAPVLAPELKRMLSTLPDTLLGVRDRALLALGFAGGFRRSELVALDVADLAFTGNGLEVHLRRSKTDQEGQGRKVGVPFGSAPSHCPVRATRAWLDAAAIAEGAVFRAMRRHGQLTAARLVGRAVARVVQRTASAAGLDAKCLAGHSLRAGLVTSAALAGKSERAIMAQTGHRSATMVRRYIRDVSLFDDNAAAGLL